MDQFTLAVIAVLFTGTLIRSALGFGEALIAVPLLALLMPVKQAAPVAVLASIAISLLILLQDWRKVHVRSATLLIVSTLAGLPLGLLLLKFAPEAFVKAILGAGITAFGLYSLLKRRFHALHDDRLAWIFGFQAGILGGAYGMNGPPLAIYGALRGWKPEYFRATLQAYFLPASVAGMVGYGVAGLWTSTVNHLFLISLPAIVLGVIAGRAIHRRIHPERFSGLVYAGLTCIGITLVLQAIRK